MGETETYHFYDFEISGRVPEPQNQYYLETLCALLIYGMFATELRGDPTLSFLNREMFRFRGNKLEVFEAQGLTSFRTL